VTARTRDPEQGQRVARTLSVGPVGTDSRTSVKSAEFGLYSRNGPNRAPERPLTASGPYDVAFRTGCGPTGNGPEGTGRYDVAKRSATLKGAEQAALLRRTGRAPARRALAPVWGPLGGYHGSEAAYLPHSVVACQSGSWSVWTLHRGTGETAVRPFRCKSWRCPTCASGVNRRDFTRLSVALEGALPEELLFVTCTFAREGSRSSAWRRARASWKSLRDRLAYRYGRRTGGTLLYAQTWEQHRDGWPHVHAVLWCPLLASAVQRCGSFSSRGPGRARRLVWRWSLDVLRPLARASGFGRTVAEPARRAGRLAGYLVKQASRLTGTWAGSIAGELTSSPAKDQTPLLAPRGFRRLRCSPGWLPPRYRDAMVTGGLLTVPYELVERSGLLEVALGRGLRTMGPCRERPARARSARGSTTLVGSAHT